MTIEKMPSKGGKTMSHQQILEKAIKLAIKGGWNFFDYTDDEDFSFSVNSDEECQGGLLVTTTGDIGEYGWHPSIIIFNHDFAKAVFGEELKRATLVNVSETHELPNWQLHLMAMVVAPDPIEYLGNNI